MTESDYVLTGSQTMNQEQSGGDVYERDAYQRYTELQLLEALESNPETSQADLATRAGVAVGTVNWYLKRWTAKGLVKVKRIGRWQWRYLLTPKGMAEKADLANRYFQASMRIYRQTRTDARQILDRAGIDDIRLSGHRPGFVIRRGSVVGDPVQQMTDTAVTKDHIAVQPAGSHGIGPVRAAHDLDAGNSRAGAGGADIALDAH